MAIAFKREPDNFIHYPLGKDAIARSHYRTGSSTGFGVSPPGNS